MAEVKKTIHVLATTKVVVDHVTCELCGKVAPPSDAWTGTAHGSEGTKVEYTSGFSHSDGFQVDIITLDICPACFKSELIPWFESKGGKVRKDNSWDC